MRETEEQHVWDISIEILQVDCQISVSSSRLYVNDTVCLVARFVIGAWRRFGRELLLTRLARDGDTLCDAEKRCRQYLAKKRSLLGLYDEDEVVCQYRICRNAAEVVRR